MPWIFANHTDDILSFYNSAALAEPLNRRSYFHSRIVLRGQKNATRGELLPGAFSLTKPSLLPEGYSAFRQIVRRHLYHNFVAWQDPNEMQSHFSGNMRQNPMSIGQFYPKHRIWQQLNYPAFNFDDVFSRHVKISGSPLVTRTVCSKCAEGE
jgi:hypothetical protein